jgi:hypothetical protein
MLGILPRSTLTRKQTHTNKQPDKNTQEILKSLHTQNNKEEAQTKGRSNLLGH